jgi:hypothetical protein
LVIFLATRASFNDWEKQARSVHRIVKDAIDRQSVFLGSFAGDLPAGVAVAVEAREPGLTFGYFPVVFLSR